MTALDLDVTQAWARASGPHTTPSQCKQADQLILLLVAEARVARPIVAEARDLTFLKSVTALIANYDRVVGS